MLRERQRLVRERRRSVSDGSPEGAEDVPVTAPQLPGGEWPALSFDVVPEGLLGMEADEVRGTLGKPSQSQDGLRVPGPDDPYMFGPRPVHLPPEAPYSEWSYHNVDGETWILWFARPGAPVQILQAPGRRTGAGVVVEVMSYPTGAVF